MNNARRKRINTVVSQLNILSEEIEAIRDDEQDAFDNLPESLQESERGEQMQGAIEALDEAVDNMSNALENLEQAAE